MWKTLFKAWVVFNILACGCCGLLVSLVPDDEGPASVLIPGADETVDFGRVVYPPDTSPEGARHFGWVTPTLRPSDHAVAYKLAIAEMTRLAASHQGYAKALNYRRLENDLMSFEGPGNCVEHLGCVYDELETHNAQSVNVLAAKFVEEVARRKLSARDAADLVVTFVQSIDYRLPKSEPFGILPPALVLSQGWGDCDSKALLAVMMLEQLGIEAVVLTSKVYRHAAVGVDVPGTDKRFRSLGRDWQYVEITAKGWPIGMVPPEVDNPVYWAVVPMQHHGLAAE